MPEGYSDSLKIVLNGEPFEVERALTISELLGQLDIDPRRVAVEHNLVVLKRGAYDATQVNEGDQVEVVNFVAGGTRVGCDDHLRSGRLVTHASSSRQGELGPGGCATQGVARVASPRAKRAACRVAGDMAQGITLRTADTVHDSSNRRVE